MSTNAPWVPSGYAEQAALLLPRLKALGHEVAVAANFGIQGTIVPWNEITVYPAHGDSGNRSIGYYAEHFGADVCLCLHDAWVMRPSAWPEDFRMAIWAPVDHYPVPPMVGAVLKNEKVRAIAMSQFGQREMERVKIPDPLYAPHMVDTRLFCPQPEIRDAVRDDMGIPRDAFLVGMVAANRGWNKQVSRKAFPQAFEAFARFSRRHDDAWLYAHTEAVPRGDGSNLENLVLALNGLEERPGRLIERIRFPSERETLMGLPRHLLAAQYVAFDVLLNPSMGEGFGVPLIEAAACGVPVIASDHSAMSELTQAGWLVQGDPWWDELQSSFAFMPHIASIEAALEAAYDARDDQELQDAAVEFALGYDADVVVTQHWEPILEQLATPREVPPISMNGNRAQRRAAKRQKAKA